MEVSNNEGLANHVVPESCAVCREKCGEALTGVCAGQPLSRDSLYITSADAIDNAEGNTMERDIASIPSTRRALRPWHARFNAAGNAVPVLILTARDDFDLDKRTLTCNGSTGRVVRARIRTDAGVPGASRHDPLARATGRPVVIRNVRGLGWAVITGDAADLHVSS